MPRTAVFAPPPELKRFGAEQSTYGEQDRLRYSGWSFMSFHGKMVDSSTLDALQDELLGGLQDYKMHLPPMIFDHDIMRIQRDSGKGTSSGSVKTSSGAAGDDEPAFIVSLRAKDALHAWGEQHSQARTATQPLAIIQVPYAKDWIERSRPYSVAAAQSEAKAGNGEEGEVGDGVSTGSAVPIDDSLARRAWDWTFSSDYCGTTASAASGMQPLILSMHSLDATVGSVFEGPHATALATHGVAERQASGIDFGLLRQRDVPILFYDEILLYQDDLEDCGEVSFDAKLRVMPHCWFLLARCFVRIDGVVVRIRESRYFHSFNDDGPAGVVHLEVTWRECSIGARTEAMADLPYPMQHCDVAPAVLRDVNKLAQIVPVVQQRFFTLQV